jgi:hypothetical protein
MKKAMLLVVSIVKLVTHVFNFPILFKPCSTVIASHLHLHRKKKSGASEAYVAMLSKTTVFHDHTAVPHTEIKELY